MRALITGMSGTGKTSVIASLTGSGYRAIDLDTDGWSRWIACDGDPTGANPGHDWLWDDARLTRTLDTAGDEPLFLAGCAPNMGRFVSRFDRILLLSAPLDVILDRVAKRTDNPYGKARGEAARIAANLHEIEPLLRRVATHEIDATQPLDRVVTAVLEALD